MKNNDLEKVVLVRATDVIPFDGVVKTLASSVNFKKDISSFISRMLEPLLNLSGVLPNSADIFNPDFDYDEYVKKCAIIKKRYLPFTMDYSSVAYYSLNGLCPDDSTNGFGNNTFSNKKCAILEPLKCHIESVISLHPTDTVIYGDQTLSKDHLILLKDEAYNNLSKEEKEKLSDKNVRIFSGELSSAVDEVLDNSIYKKEKLTLSSSFNGVMPSNSSEDFKNSLKQITSLYGLSNVHYTNFMLSENYRSELSIGSKDIVETDLNNYRMLTEIYEKEFLFALISELGLNDVYSNKLDLIKRFSSYQDELAEHILKMGLVRYEVFIDKYNKNFVLENSITPNEKLKTMKEKTI